MILNAFDLKGKVAIVTGCDTGLGQGMALGLAEAGCDIVGINIVEPTDNIAKIEAIGRRLGDDASTLSFFLFGRPKVGWDVRSKWFTVDSTINYGGVAWRTRQTLKRTTQDIVPIGP